MINTRRTIFETLKKRIRELTKHANPAPLEFKKIILAVILNDLKKWSGYIPKENDSNNIVKLLENYIINNCFIISRVPIEDNIAYVNVNTPQTNDTWSRVWDKNGGYKLTLEPVEPQCEPWIPDSNCEVKLIYFISADENGNPITNTEYLESVYGKYGQKLKTICDKMNVFVDRETGIGWYLDNSDCTWKRIGSKIEDGMTQDEVEALIAQYRINPEWSQDGSKIELTLKKGVGYNNTLNLLTKDEVEAMI